jgi:hypothetical protein
MGKEEEINESASLMRGAPKAVIKPSAYSFEKTSHHHGVRRIFLACDF